MSRPSVFSRIASWLKNTAKINEKQRQKEANERVHRQYTVQTLEDRQMLDAAFMVDSGLFDRLILDNFSETVAEGLTISETADDYRFLLAEGVWTGTNDAARGIFGNGSSDLRVAKTPPLPNIFDIDEIRIDDTLGVDILFDNVNFAQAGAFVTNFRINTNRGDIDQTVVSQIGFNNFIVDGANDVTLPGVNNQFNLVTITDTNNAQVRDSNAMNLGRIQINNDADFENNGLMILNRPFDAGGDAILNANNGDIYQERDAAIFVGGETFLKSNATDEFGIDFGFGDRDGDGLNDNDFVGRVHVLQGAQIEIVDINSLTIGDVTTHGNNIRDVFSFYAEAESGQITVDGVISVPGTDDANGKVILRAGGGGVQTNSGRIITDELAIIGDGDFVFDKANEALDLNAGLPGVIAADVTGNLLYHNEEALTVGAVSFEFIAERLIDGSPAPRISGEVNAVHVRSMPDGSDGNLTMTTSDDDLSQNGTAPVRVDELTTIDVGTGDVIWNFGDELGNLLNDNDWNVLDVVNANDASFVDVNWIVVGDINVANDARFMADNDNRIFLDGEVVVGNNVLFQSDIGLTQLSGFVDASGMAVQGNGDFVFDLTNRLGDTAAPGQVAANLDSGEFVVENIDGLEVSSLTIFGENIVGIDGVSLGKTSLRGDEILVNDVINVGSAFLESATTISQTTAITADELIFRSNEDTDLSVDNNVMVIAGEVEGSLTYNTAIEFTVGKLTIDGTTVAGISVENGDTNDFNLNALGVDIHQNLDAPVIVDGTMTIDIGLGCLGFAFGDGDGDTINDNDFNVVVINSGLRIELVDRNDVTTNAVTVDDQIRIASETGTINLEGNLTATNIVLLQAGNGVQQNPDDAGVEGIINTPALMLQGDGAFDLDHENEVGDATDKGELAIEINGSFNLQNMFELVSKSLSFDLKDGSTVTINGFIINSGGDALILNVSGLVIETEIMAPKIIINTTGDIIQGAAGRFITDALVLTGTGNFELTALNQIGTAGTPGLLAIDVEGDVEILNEFGLDFGQIVCGTDLFQGAALVPGAFADGDLTLRTTGQDITQTGDSIFAVGGTTTFDVGAGNVNLPGFALAQNDFGIIKVESADTVELVDTNSVIIEETTVTNNFKVQAGAFVPAQIVLDDNINVGNKMLLMADLGISQTRGFIVADTLLLEGGQDFDLNLDNEVNRIGTDISGNLVFQNHVDLEIVKDDYTDMAGGTISFAGLELTPTLLDGNLILTTSNDDVSQAADAHVQVAEAAAFDLGAGELDLTFGDSNGDTLNDNDLNVIAVASASNAEVVDQNSIGIDNVNVANNLFIQSEGGSISIQGEVIADNAIMLKSILGAGTRFGALLDTDTLLVEGRGDFSLSGDNRIGAAAVSGDVGIDVVGNVFLNNDFGVHFNDVTFTQLDGTTHNLLGANVDVNGFAGNLFVNAGGDITDDDSVDILVDGSAAFVAAPSSDVHIGGVNTVMASSVGLGGQNVVITMDNALILDGVMVTGDLFAQSKGDITQSGIDVSGFAGSRFVVVNGDTNFVVDSISGAVEQRSVNLLSVGNSLMNNRFDGGVMIEGTSFLGTGSGEMGSVQLRNSKLDTAMFPTINRGAGDQLTALSVWAPNSSLTIRDMGAGIDYDIENNMSIFAGVDSETGLLGGNLKVTDNAKTRSLRDDAGVSIVVGGNLNTNAANTLILADQATDSIMVGDTLGLVNQGGANENRIRIGVGSGGTRGDDSGAVVTTDKLRTRANRFGTDGHVTVNIDGDVVFTSSNFGTSLVVVADGDILDDANASISVQNSAFFDANGGAGNIQLGDDNFTNRTIFGSVGFKGNNVSFTEDTAAILNGTDVGGNFDVFAKGSIKQSGLDRSGRAGTVAIEVDGDSTFTVDGNALPGDHLKDPAGRDIKLMSNGSQDLIDNRFGGGITIQSTQKLSGGVGTVRTVEIRNTVINADVPTFNIDASDKLRHLTLWYTNSSVDLGPQANAVDYDIAGDMMVIAGLDSANGKLNGNKVIVNDAVLRNITDSNNVSIKVARNASYYAANHITLVDNATNSLEVGLKSTFVSQSGSLGNDINVGTSGPRGNDSGGTYETGRLKFTIVDNGFGGDLTIVADSPFNLDVTSSAPSVFLSP